MKIARLRALAKRDLAEQLAYYRREAGMDTAHRLRLIAQSSLAQVEQNPGLGSPVLGKVLGIDALRTWRMSGFPLLWVYIERTDHLDVARLLGQRQDIIAVLEPLL